MTFGKKKKLSPNSEEDIDRDENEKKLAVMASADLNKRVSSDIDTNDLLSVSDAAPKKASVEPADRSNILSVKSTSEKE